MIRTYTLLLLCFIFHLQATAQYADAGTGVLKNHIWWFDWAGFTIADGASKTFTTTDGLTVAITFSNVAGPAISPSVMNTWDGAVLHFLYDFSNPNIKPALLAPVTLLNSQFTITVTATRNGMATPFTLVAADAEGSLRPVENTTLQTSGGNWRTLEFFRNSTQTSNPVTGCGTQTVIITDTHHPAAAPTDPFSGQNPMMATDAPATGTVQVEVHLDKTRRGGMAVAFGIFAPVDRGDLPASYGYAQHQLTYTNTNSCNYNAPFPAIIQAGTLKLGNVMADADAFDDTDDNLGGVDEEGVTFFPDYTGSGTYSIDLPVTNTTAGNAFLSGYFDYNRNGVFDPVELVSVTVPVNAAAVRLTWTGLPARLSAGAVENFGFRLRLSTDPVAIQSAAGFAKDGEVEDYLQELKVLCDIVTVVTKSNDVDCAHGEALLLASGGTQYKWEAAAGISNLHVANPVVTPMEPTTYYVTITDANGCSKQEAITVGVDLAAAIGKYPLPSAFTPNKDGKNDCFGLKYWGAVRTLTFSIYNRWGQLVFSTHASNDCWDGTFKGALQPAGTYVYMIKAKTLCGEVERKGTVVLVL